MHPTTLFSLTTFLIIASLTSSTPLENPTTDLIALLDFSTDIKTNKIFAEFTYTYNFRSLSNESLELKFALPKAQAGLLTSFHTTSQGKTTNLLVVDTQALQNTAIETDLRVNTTEIKPNSVPSDPALNLVYMGLIDPEESIKVVLSTIVPLQVEKDRLWSVRAPVNIADGPLLLTNSSAGVEKITMKSLLENPLFEQYRVQVSRQKDAEFEYVVPDSARNAQNTEDGLTWTLKRGEASINTDFIAYYIEKNPSPYRAILGENAKHKEDYVLFLDIPVEAKTSSAQGSLVIKESTCNPTEQGEKNAQEEYIFVMDRGYAKNSQKMETLQAMLGIALEELPEGAYFNIVSYASNSLFYKFESVKADENTKKDALNWVLKSQGHLEEKTSSSPIKGAASFARREGLFRTVLLFTGQEVSDGEELIQYMTENSHNTRFCHLHIGEGFGNLHTDIEKAGRCMSTSVTNKEEAIKKVKTLLETVKTSRLEEVSLHVKCFNKENQEVFDKQESLGYLSHGQSLKEWVYLKELKGLDHCEGTLSFVKPAEKSCQVKFSVPKQSKTEVSEVLHKVAYSSMIRNLAYVERDNKPNVNTLRKSSVKYQVPSQYTLLVSAPDAEQVDNIGYSKLVQEPYAGVFLRNGVIDAKVLKKALKFDDSTQVAMDKLFGVEEEVELDSEAQKEKKRKEDLERDEFMLKIVIGVAVFVGILFVLSKFLMKNYAEENAKLKEEQERLEGEFYARFNKKKKNA